MLSPTLDLLCVGGLSLLVMVPLLLAGRTDLLLVSAGVQAWIADALAAGEIITDDHTRYVVIGKPAIDDIAHSLSDPTRVLLQGPSKPLVQVLFPMPCSGPEPQAPCQMHPFCL